MITCGRGDKEAISTQRYTDRLVWNGLLDSWPNGKPCPDAPPLLAVRCAYYTLRLLALSTSAERTGVRWPASKENVLANARCA